MTFVVVKIPDQVGDDVCLSGMTVIAGLTGNLYSPQSEALYEFFGA